MSKRQFKMLDLFCCSGLASWGYWRSGRFSEIVGVDIDSHQREYYAFDFVHTNAITLDYEFLQQFDFIHASPPCQAYSRITPNPSDHERLILPVKHMLYASGIPHVIENVINSSRELKPNIALNGYAFGLPHDRTRLFFASTLATPLRLIGRGNGTAIHGTSLTRKQMIEVMGLSTIPSRQLARIPVTSMEQGIPPAMTKFIAETLFDHTIMIGS